uniref:Uncharacterized protein n=1 Tax=Arundo donax TaxID=35708 RepID=A0A0A9HUQ6_ARUDO
MACCAPSLNCMKLLVEAGADVNFKSPSGPTALMMAVDDGLTDIVKFLLEVGADPNIRDHHGKTPIMYAAGSGRRELVEILFPRTKPIPVFPDWSVDGIINTMKYLPSNAQICNWFLTSFQHNLYSWSLMIAPCFLIRPAVVNCAIVNTLCCIILEVATSLARITHSHELCLHPWT